MSHLAFASAGAYPTALDIGLAGLGPDGPSLSDGRHPTESHFKPARLAAADCSAATRTLRAIYTDNNIYTHHNFKKNGRGSLVLVV